MFASAASAQQEQHKYDPFFENLLYQSQVYGLEMVSQRLKMAEAFPPPINADLEKQLRRMEQRDFSRFRGTLAERDPTLEANLAAALHA